MKRKVCLSLLLLLLLNLAAGAKVRSFDTVLLRSMAESMRMHQCLDTLADGIYTELFQYRGKSVTIRIRYGQVQHIGYTLFPTEVRQILANDAVCDFLERHSLQAQLPLERIKSVEKANQEADVVFLAGSMQLIPQCVGDSTLAFSVTNYGDKGYVVNWDKEGESYCSLRFPADYYLLHGTDYAEAKEALVRDLTEWADTTVVPQSQLDTMSLRMISNPDIFVSIGDSLFLSHLSTNSFYNAVDSASYKLLDSPLFPVETFANLAVKGGIENQIDLHLALSKSDYGMDAVDLKLNQLLSYLREKGCVMYYGLQEYGPDAVVALMIAANKAEGYCHSIRLQCHKHVLMEKKGQMSGRMSSFIPLSRIKDLFEDHHSE